MITDRDIEIFRFINTFGYSFLPVMSKTFFSSEITARARFKLLFDRGFLNRKKSNLIRPRYFYYLSTESQFFLREHFEDRISTTSPKETRIAHIMLEQVAYFYLSCIGKVERTTVATHYKELNHIPDLIYTDEKNRKFYIECETSIKSRKAYDELVLATLKDSPYAVIYVAENAQKAKSIANTLPTSDKLFFIDIESLRENIKKTEKISPVSQKNMLKKS